MRLRYRINVRAALENVACIGILILAPGVVAYHLIFAALNTSPAFSGLYGLGSLAIFLTYAVLVLPFPGYFTKRGVAYFPFFIWVFLGYCVIVSLIALFLSDDEYLSIAFRQSTEMIILYSAWFMVGVYFKFDRHITNLLLIATFGSLVIFLVIYHANVGGGAFYAEKLLGGSAYSGFYQALARSFVIISVIVIALAKSWKMRQVLVGLSLLILFLIGARSEFLGFLFFSLVMSVLVWLQPKFFLYGAGTIAVFFVAAGFIYYEPSALSGFTETRIGSVINLAENNSWTSRTQLRSTAIDQIKQNPIAGKFGGHVAFYGTEGSYSHDVLSAWVNYGLVGFLLVVGLTAYSAIKSAYLFYAFRGFLPESVAALGFSSIALLLALGAKPVFWPMTALAWGFTFNLTKTGERRRLLVSQ